MGTQSDNSIVVGEIDRISGSGNAILNQGGYNLGPLPREVVGNKAIAIPLSSTWAICLTPFIDRETYISEFISTNGTPKDRFQIERAIESVQLSAADEVNHLNTRPSDPIKPGTTIDVQVTNSGSNGSYVFFEDGIGAELYVPFIPPGTETSIKVTDPSLPIMSAQIADSVFSDAPDPGSKLTLKIIGTKRSNAYAVHNSVPVRLPECPASTGDHVHASVISEERNYITAGISGLPASEKGEIGDSFELDLQLTPEMSEVTLIHEGIPIEIPAPELPFEGQTPVNVTDIGTNSVTAEVDFTKIAESQFEEGEELLVNDLRMYDDQLLGRYDGIPILINVTELPTVLPDTLTVVITDISVNDISAIIKTKLKKGDTLTIEDIEQRQNRIVGQYEAVPVTILPEETPPVLADSLDVTVTEISANKVVAEIRPNFEAGDKLTISHIERRGDRFVGQYNGIPVVLPLSVLPPITPETLDIAVTSVSKNQIAARITTEFDKGDEITVRKIEERGNEIVGHYDGIPVTLPGSELPPVLPDSLDAAITGISEQKIAASIKPHNRLKSIQVGSIITAEIESHEHGHLIGKYNEFPVWVPHNGDLIPNKLTVTINQLTDLGIFASFSALPEEAVPEVGEIIPAQIDSVSQVTAVAWVEVTGDFEPYAVPIVIPSLLNPQDTAGIEIVENNTYPLTGIVRSDKVGKEVTSVSEFELDTQRALVSLYNNSTGNAVVPWESALNSTNSVLREVNARRSVTYGRAEEALKENQAETSESLLEEFKAYVKSTEIPTQYQEKLLSEAQAYGRLITASEEEETPDSATNLQQIAINFDVRNQVDDVAADLPRPSCVNIKNWTPVFPHPFVVDRLRKLCSQFESVPSAARGVLDAAPVLSEAYWTIPPSEESAGKTTLDILPFAPDMSPQNVENKESDGNTTNIEVATDTENESDAGRESKVTDTFNGTNSSEPTTNHISKNSSDKEHLSKTSSGREDEPSVTDTPPKSEQEQADLPSKEAEDYIGNDHIDSERNGISIPKTTEQLRELRKKAEEAASDDPVRDISQPSVGSRYQRAEAIKEYVKTRANGICEGCKEPAPFDNADGEPYLEAHHVDELGKGGQDHPSKVVALCPTCHKRVHHGQNGTEFNTELRDKLRNGLADVGAE